MHDGATEYSSVWGDLKTLSFEQRYVDAGGVSTRYVHAGTPGAPVLIMVHGTGGHWEGFSANLAAHAAHFECFALDLIGSGFSDKPNRPYEIADYVAHLRDFMTAMGITRASFIGVSLGAWVVSKLAIDHPEQVDRMILLSAAGYFSTPGNRARIQSTRTASVENPTWENISGIFKGLMRREERRIPDLIALRQAIYRQPAMKQAMQNILALQDQDIRNRNLIPDADWRSIAAPTLIVGAKDDADEYLETARVVSNLIPQATYVSMDNVGHWPQFEDPETFNALSIPFLSGR